MEFETQRRPTPSINLSALIDVAFILVIFIVLAANFDRIRALKVKLPEADASASADASGLVITVPATGPVDIQGTKVGIEAVRAKLRAMKPRYDSVLLVADQAASIQRAVRILGDAQAVGFESVGIATQGKAGGTP